MYIIKIFGKKHHFNRRIVDYTTTELCENIELMYYYRVLYFSGQKKSECPRAQPWGTPTITVRPVALTN